MVGVESVVWQRAQISAGSGIALFYDLSKISGFATNLSVISSPCILKTIRAAAVDQGQSQERNKEN